MNITNNNVSQTEKVPTAGAGDRESVSTQTTGLYATMDNLIFMLQKMNSEMRDLQRDYYTSQQEAAFAKEMRAYDSKKVAIGMNYEAAKGNAIAKMVSGGLSLVGAAGGGLASFKGINGGEFISSGFSGSGKVIEGGTTLGMAGKSRDAQLKQALGEYQTNDAKEYYKSLDAVREKAAEASRRIVELTRELMSMQERIMSAVRI
ncbi:type III secretion system translocon protein SseD [Serratia quinivorans]|uniref:hypothetical protein n=1 Tax=Serratia quinivorans TaxID=137545 RepID=UPI002177D74D|nr:hypothetical protein [Serratia quinivorans]CAI1196236.1 Secretion system effector D [Serratia quinivorans]